MVVSLLFSMFLFSVFPYYFIHSLNGGQVSCMLVMGGNTYKNRFLDTLEIVGIELKIQGHYFVTFSKCQNYADGEQTSGSRRLGLGEEETISGIREFLCGGGTGLCPGVVVTNLFI